MRLRRFKNPLIFSIGAIVLLSVLGAGYAAWSNGIMVNTSVKTGYINPVFEINDRIIDQGHGQLELNLADDSLTLNIDGEVYPTFNEEIRFKIIDKGSIPVTMDGMKIIASSDIEEISSVNIMENNKYARDNTLETFVMRINPDLSIRIYNYKNDYSDDFEDNIYGENIEELQAILAILEAEAEALEAEIEGYNFKKDYDFKYQLLANQKY